MKMPRAARVGDLHKGTCNHGMLCCPHDVIGPIIGGSSDTYVNSKPQARVGDAVRHNCPHCGTGQIVEGSSTVFVNGKRVARIGDRVKYPGGSGIIIEGSDNVYEG